MRLFLSLCLLTTVALVGCNERDANHDRAVTQAAAPVAPTQVEPEPEPVAAPRAAPRRERAGIDLGAAPAGEPQLIDGRKPAARLVAITSSSRPARLEGMKATGAAAARAFVVGPWKTAVEASEPAQLRGLCADDFKGMLPSQEGSPKPVDADGWISARGGIGAPVVLGDIAVAMVHSAMGDSTVRFRERRGEGEVAGTRIGGLECRCRGRRLLACELEDDEDELRWERRLDLLLDLLRSFTATLHCESPL